MKPDTLWRVLQTIASAIIRLAAFWRWTICLLGILVLGGGVIRSAWAGACDWQWDVPIFTPGSRPLHDYTAFTRGQLGIITGDLDSVHLFVAWRHFNGFPLPDPCGYCLNAAFWLHQESIL
jgi:hypothetical protein